MTVFTETYIPYEFNNKMDCYKYVVNRALNIQKSLRFIEKIQSTLLLDALYQLTI